MFDFFRKKADVEVEETREESEKFGLKEYVSVDSIRAHFVETLEENRELKKRLEDNRNFDRKRYETEKKQKEMALVEVDEWKRRAKEKDGEILKLQKQVDEADRKIEELTRRNNFLITEQEVSKKNVEKAADIRREAIMAGKSLKSALEKYHGHDWEKAPKSALVNTLKMVLCERENEAAE